MELHPAIKLAEHLNNRMFLNHEAPKESLGQLTIDLRTKIRREENVGSNSSAHADTRMMCYRRYEYLTVKTPSLNSYTLLECTFRFDWKKKTTRELFSAHRYIHDVFAADYTYIELRIFKTNNRGVWKETYLFTDTPLWHKNMYHEYYRLLNALYLIPS